MDGLRLANEVYKVTAKVRKDHGIHPAVAEELLRLHFGDPRYVSDQIRRKYANESLKLNNESKAFINDLRLEITAMLKRLESEGYRHLLK